MTMSRIGIALIIWLTLTVSLIYAILDPIALECDIAKAQDPTMVCARFVDLAITLLLIISAIITLFGIFSIDGAQNPDGSFRETRIRLSIAVTVVVVYLIYFGLAILWGEQYVNENLFESFTNLMMVIIPFYFASSAAVEWAEKRNAS